MTNERRDYIANAAQEIESVALHGAENKIQALRLICVGIDEPLADKLVDEYMNEWAHTEDAIKAAAHKAAVRRWNLHREVT